MRIVTWNCNGSLRTKLNHIKTFEADIVIVQECENPKTAKDKQYQDWAAQYLWTGENNSRGLGIFASDKVTIENLNWDTKTYYGNSDINKLKYFISCLVNNDFTLLGTWCHGAKSPTFGYCGQFWQFLQKHKTKLNKTIIAGDFNSNAIWDEWDRWWNHSDIVRELKELKIESAYHEYFKEEQGKESKPTFFLQKNPAKPYHIDYIFTSEEFTKSIKTMTIGDVGKWLAISDHMPVICEIN